MKWDAWKQAESAYGEKDQVAEERYLQLAKDLGWVEGVALVDTSEASSTARSGDGENEDDIWDDEETSKRYKSSGGGMGNTLSTMAAGEEDGRREDSPHQFAISGDTEGLKALLQSHAEIDLNAVDEYVMHQSPHLEQTLRFMQGYTPLHLASDRGHLPVVELLLASNVDLSIKVRHLPVADADEIRLMHGHTGLRRLHRS